VTVAFALLAWDAAKTALVVGDAPDGLETAALGALVAAGLCATAALFSVAQWHNSQ
jgi:hypothetical protein